MLEISAWYSNNNGLFRMLARQQLSCSESSVHWCLATVATAYPYQILQLIVWHTLGSACNDVFLTSPMWMLVLHEHAYDIFGIACFWLKTSLRALRRMSSGFCPSSIEGIPSGISPNLERTSSWICAFAHVIVFHLGILSWSSGALTSRQIAGNGAILPQF